MPIQIGAEFEFLSTMNVAAVTENIQPLDLNIGLNNGQYDHWTIKGDGSLRGSGGRGNYGHEIVTPILPLETGLAKIKQFFEWMEANGHYTNSTCGFHIGVSLDAAAMQNLDALKLCLLFDATSVLRSFGRLHSTYCRPLRRALLDNIRRQAPYWDMARQVGAMNQGGVWRGNLDELQKINLLVPYEKFTSSNLTKLRIQNTPYVEFRCMGNENYHGRWEEVRDTINYYAEMIQIACEEQAEKKKYDLELNRLTRMVGRVKVIESDRFAEQIRLEREREEARLRPLLERDLARRNMRAGRAAERRSRELRLAQEFPDRIQTLDLGVLSAREIRHIVRPPVEALPPAPEAPIDAEHAQQMEEFGNLVIQNEQRTIYFTPIGLVRMAQFRDQDDYSGPF